MASDRVTLADFLQQCTDVTKDHILARGSSWPLRDQLVKISEEHIELTEAAVRNDRSNVMEEASDTILATITYLTLYGFTAPEIEAGIMRTLAKVQDRMHRRILEAKA